MWSSLQWLVGDWTVFSVQSRYWIGFLAAIACFFITAKTAWAVQSERDSNPQLFTVMALFASAWVAVSAIYELPPYGADTPKCTDDAVFKLHDRAADLSSFLFVFVGAMLAREGRDDHWLVNSKRLQVAGLSLLFALVIPAHVPEQWMSPRVLDLLISEVLTVVGFVALGAGARAVARPLWFWSLMPVLVLYCGLTLFRGVQLLLVTPRCPLSDFMILAFAVLKFLMTGMLCLIVLRHSHYQSELRAKPA